MKLSLDWIQTYVGELPDDPKAIGIKMTLATAEIEGLESHGSDTVYDIDNKSLTHRPDLWGHYGFAREVAAVYQRPLQALVLDPCESSGSDPLQVSIAVSENLCPRYTGLVVEGIQVGPSPEWLAQALEKVGARSVNNIVDLTNYVMFELGQPMHAFDRHKLSGDIVVRLAQPEEMIDTLDGAEHKLSEQMMVIADAEKAVAIAGVMGGANSEVSEQTTCLVLESANFHPTHVRRTAAALGIRTDSSMRFEKGLDPSQTDLAIQRFVHLLKQICPEVKVLTPILAVGVAAAEPILIATDFDYINQRLGTQLPDQQIQGILERLGFEITLNNRQLTVRVPSFRATGDISIPMDLVEEVGRVFGYDNITPIEPLIPVQPVVTQPLHAMQRLLRQVLSRDLAFVEVYNYAFVGEQLLQKSGLSSEGLHALANPLASDQNLLRSSLVPNMLKITAENLRFRKQFRLYELERVFLPELQSAEFEFERHHLCGLLCDVQWRKEGVEDAFYQSKGALEDLLAQLNLAGRLRFRPATAAEREPWCHPGRTATVWIDETAIGYLTQLHPQIAANFGIKAGVGLFNLDLSTVLTLPQAKASFAGVQKYPVVPFDVAVISDEQTLIADVEDLIRNVDQRVRQVALFDLYRGDNIGAGKKSLAFSVTFSAPDHTLQPEEVETLQNGVMQALNAAGHQVRDGG